MAFEDCAKVKCGAGSSRCVEDTRQRDREKVARSSEYVLLHVPICPL